MRLGASLFYFATSSWTMPAHHKIGLDSIWVKKEMEGWSMRRMSGKLRKRAFQWLDLPPDVTSDVPRIQMIGSQQIAVENYREVTHFSDGELRLRLSEGTLCIKGAQLTIRAIYRDEVWIEGNIHGIEFTK